VSGRSVRHLWSLIRLARRIPVPVPANPYYDPSKPHHLPTGFRNRHPDRPPTAEERARAARARELERAAAVVGELEVVAPELEFLAANRDQPTVTWIGHATVLVQIAGRNIITDPMFSTFASPIQLGGPRRRQPPGIALHALPRIDLVLLSHGHFDHADKRSLRGLACQPGGAPHFVVPLGMERWLRRIARLPESAVTALDWWDAVDLDGTHVTLTPAHHWNARTPWNRNQHLWGSFAVERSGFRFFFSGDTAYSEDSKDIGRRLGPFDLAAIAIGHYEPRLHLKNHHINPHEAVLVHREIGARHSMACHWGTFDWLTPESLYQPVADLIAAREALGVAPDEFFLLRHGETRRL
jgi:L-ascorbate metabolism protein UlaG (beta-lactamase superfamily)